MSTTINGTSTPPAKADIIDRLEMAASTQSAGQMRNVVAANANAKAAASSMRAWRPRPGFNDVRCQRVTGSDQPTS